MKHWIGPYCKKQPFLKLFCSVTLKTTLNRAAKSVYNNLDIAHRRTQPCNGPLSGTTGVGQYKRNIHPLTPILIVRHPLSTFSIYHDPWSSVISYENVKNLKYTLFRKFILEHPVRICNLKYTLCRKFILEHPVKICKQWQYCDVITRWLIWQRSRLNLPIRSNAPLFVSLWAKGRNKCYSRWNDKWPAEENAG